MCSASRSKILPLYAVAVATALAQGPEESAIRTVIEKMEQGWNTHDMDLYMSVFSPDASFVNVNGWWWRGFEEIKAAYVTAHRTTFQRSRAEVVMKKIRFPSPQLAVAHAAWKVLGDVRNPEARDYLMTLVLNKQSGDWLITDGQNNSPEDRSSNASTPNLSTDATFHDSAGQEDLHPRAAEFQRFLSAFDASWTKGDTAAAVRAYAPTADVVDPAADWLRGRQEILKDLSDWRNETFRDGQYALQIAVLVLPEPNTAIATVRWKADDSAAG